MIERGNKDWRLMSRPRLDFIKETPRSSEFDDDYYSPEDGLAESTYVFIEGGDVINRMQALQAGETLTIGELGLGTALNLALILQAWSEHGPAGARCHVITIEKHPLSRSQLRAASARWTSLIQEFETILQRWPSPIPGCHRRSELIDGLTVDFWWEDVSDAHPHEMRLCGQRMCCAVWQTLVAIPHMPPHLRPLATCVGRSSMLASRCRSGLASVESGSAYTAF